ncbi:MAG: large conductance mechanosensitive channel protein MscL [Firmicutes bacterium]|nr:large conductance mechanosensitive channel protein MscL [Bacillota bacterium]
MKKLLNEFKEFINRGNVLDMAIGVIIATAFSAITTSLINDVIMPAIGLLTGNADDAVGALDIVIKTGRMVTDETTGLEVAETVTIGLSSFVSSIMNFLIIALVCFLIVKVFNKANSVANAKKIAEEKAAEEEKKRLEEEAAANKAPTTEELLTEIRDLLAQSKESDT